MSYQRIDERLLAAQLAIDNALADADIKAELALFGYDDAKLAQGQALHNDAQATVQAQMVEYGEQYAASEEFRQKWEAAQTVYGRTLKVARIAFKDDFKAQAALMLTGKRKGSFSGWLEQAEAFYDNMLAKADFVSTMGTYGYDTVKLQAEADVVAAANVANKEQQQEIGDAQDMTKARDAKLDALDDWMSDFRGIAEVALAERPQLLEKLGFGAIA